MINHRMKTLSTKRKESEIIHTKNAIKLAKSEIKAWQKFLIKAESYLKKKLEDKKK